MVVRVVVCAVTCRMGDGDSNGERYGDGDGDVAGFLLDGAQRGAPSSPAPAGRCWCTPARSPPRPSILSLWHVACAYVVWFMCD